MELQQEGRALRGRKIWIMGKGVVKLYDREKSLRNSKRGSGFGMRLSKKVEKSTGQERRGGGRGLGTPDSMWNSFLSFGVCENCSN